MLIIKGFANINSKGRPPAPYGGSSKFKAQNPKPKPKPKKSRTRPLWGKFKVQSSKSKTKTKDCRYHAGGWALYTIAPKIRVSSLASWVNAALSVSRFPGR